MNLYHYEIMDRTHVIMEMLQNHILDNEGITPEMEKLVEKAHTNLFDLYQLAGKSAFGEDEDD